MNLKAICSTSKLNLKKWTDFMETHPHANIFQTLEMYEVYKATKNYEPVFLAITDKDGNISGSLLAVIQKEHAGLLGTLSTRAIIIGGPLIKNNDPKALDYLLKEYAKIIKRAIYTQFRNLWDWKEQKEIFTKNGFAYEDHLDILFDLSESEDDLWKGMKNSCRKNINKSYRNNIKVEEINLGDNKLLIESFNILKNVYLRIKLPFPDKTLFENAVKYLCNKKYLHTQGAFLQDELIGIRILLCYKKILYDWYAGAKDEFLSYKPNDILPWEIMKWGIKNGYEMFDFGGAGKPDIPYGVRDYKLKFGGKLVNYGRFTKTHKPFLFRTVKFGFKFWQKLNRKL